MTEHDVKYYMELPYTIVIRKDEEGDFVARIEELAGCTAHGPTQEDALRLLAEVQTGWLEEAIEAGQSIPEPRVEERFPSGKWVQRVPRSLHRKLTKMAEAESVSLNHLVSTILAEAAGTVSRVLSVSPSAWEDEQARGTNWKLTTAGTAHRLVLMKALTNVTMIQEKGSETKGNHAKEKECEYPN